MSPLENLKEKWFIPIGNRGPDGIPCHRGPVSANQLSSSTDGNLVTPLIDGKECMRAWHDDVVGLASAKGGEVLHTGWRFEAVNTLGATSPTSDALRLLVTAAGNGANVSVLACMNPRCFRFNNASLQYLRRRGVSAVRLDGRYPPGGSSHQKFTVIKGPGGASAILGSADIAKTRWDTSRHLASDPDRDPLLGEQTHETAVSIRGPAVADLERTYRERWNAPSGRRFLSRRASRPENGAPLPADPGEGTHSVQVLRTYGVTSSMLGYPWSPVGEFTVWASHLNAIKKASTYVYIEDQYFLAFGWPPRHARNGVARETDLVYQLGEALKRGVDVVLLTSNKPTTFWYPYQKHQRDIGLNYLLEVGASGSHGKVVAASLWCEGHDVYVHSKLMIVDDEFVSIGSANISQRSMAVDSELQVGIVDEAEAFAREFRTRLWAEHTGLPPDRLVDPRTGIDLFARCTADRLGHLKPYPVDPPSTFPPRAGRPFTRPGHPIIVRRAIDPYAGPRDLR